MPRLTMETPHALGQEEAVRRLKRKFSTAVDHYGDQAKDLHEEWNDNTFSFRFKTVGMKVSGTVTVEASRVKLDTSLPFAAMIFKGKIKQQVRKELGDLLA